MLDAVSRALWFSVYASACIIKLYLIAARQSNRCLDKAMMDRKMCFPYKLMNFQWWIRAAHSQCAVVARPNVILMPQWLCSAYLQHAAKWNEIDSQRNFDLNFTELWFFLFFYVFIDPIACGVLSRSAMPTRCEQKTNYYYFLHSPFTVRPFRREIAGDVHFSLLHLFCTISFNANMYRTDSRHSQAIEISQWKSYTVFRRHLSQPIIVCVSRAFRFSSIRLSVGLCAVALCGIDCMCLLGPWAIYTD